MVIGSRHEKFAAVPIDFGQGKYFLANHVNGGVPMVFNDLDWHGPRAFRDRLIGRERSRWCRGGDVFLPIGLLFL